LRGRKSVAAHGESDATTTSERSSTLRIDHAAGCLH
jgi:hypothetical protein